MLTPLSNGRVFYQTPDAEHMSQWRTSVRTDSLVNPRAQRFHQVVKPVAFALGAGNEFTLSGVDLSRLPRQRYGIIGFASDVGVKLNGGRVGAARGPDGIRGGLRNKPVHFTPNEVGLLDFGNIVLPSDENEQGLIWAQAALSSAVNLLLSHDIFPIVLGGGHEVAYGHGHGIMERIQTARGANSSDPGIHVVNFDAHWDLRLREERGHYSSGTPFSQLHAFAKEIDLMFNYMCVGVEYASNTPFLFDRAQEIGARHVLGRDIHTGNLPAVLEQVGSFLGQARDTYVTVCMDFFAQAAAPGVSAPNVDGVDPKAFYPILRRITETRTVRSLDIAETAPSLDPDGRTSELAARIIHEFIRIRYTQEKNHTSESGRSPLALADASFSSEIKPGSSTVTARSFGAARRTRAHAVSRTSPAARGPLTRALVTR